MNDEPPAGPRLLAPPRTLRDVRAYREAVTAAAIDDLAEAYPVILALNDGPAGFTAARRLGRAAHLGAVDAAIRALAERRVVWTHLALLMLGLAGVERAVPISIEYLPDPAQLPRDSVTYEAVTALGRIATAEAAHALIEAARHHAARLSTEKPRDTSTTYAERLVWALCRIGTAECLDAVLLLTAAMHTLWDEATVRALARVADERFTPFLLELCSGPRQAAALVGLGRAATVRAVPTLIQIIGSAPDRKTRALASRALLAVGEPARGALIHQLPDRHPAWASLAVGRAPHAAAMPRILPGEGAEVARRLLRDGDDRVRARAARSLGALDNPAAASDLRAAAAGDPSYRVRACAAWAIGRMKLTEAGAALGGTTLAEVLADLRTLADQDPVPCVRAAAYAALRAMESL